MLIFNALIASSLEMLLQKHILARPNSEVYLKPLHGKRLTLCLHCQGYQAPPQTLIFTFPAQNDDLNVHNSILIQAGEKVHATEQTYAKSDNVIISITPFDLVRLLNKEIELPYDNIQVSGNLKILTHFEQLVKLTGVDLRAMLSLITGHSLAHSVTNNLESALSWGRKNISQRCNELNDYAKYEAEVLIDTLELDMLKQAVYELSQAINLLSNRVDTIEVASVRRDI